MARISSNDWLDIGTWEQGENPGAGGQNFSVLNNTGLNGNWIRIWKVLSSFFTSLSGTIKNNVIGAENLKTNIVDNSTLEISGSPLSLKVKQISTEHIASNAISEIKLKDNCVSDRVLANHSSNNSLRAVGTNHIKDGAITKSKLSDKCVSTDKFEFGEYVALISQTGTNAPSAIVLRNTVDLNIYFSRVSAGIYKINSAMGKFIFTRTICFASGVSVNGATINIKPYDDYSIDLITCNASGTPADSIIGSSKICSILIRVYPEEQSPP